MDPRRVSPSEAFALLAEGYVYVDVRTPEEFALGRPAGSINIPWLIEGPGGRVPNPDFLSAMKERFALDAKLVLGCRSGVRSLNASRALLAEGFVVVIDQRAGWEGPRDAFGAVLEPGWSGADLPIESD